MNLSDSEVVLSISSVLKVLGKQREAVDVYVETAGGELLIL